MVNSNPTSPAHYALAGNFTPEDIQELLGVMGDEQHKPQTTESSSVAASLEEPRSELGSNLLKGEDFKDDTDCLDDIPDDCKVQARSERKRSRERQRRSDVNRQFADLTHLLRQLEDEEAEDENSKARLAFNPANRVDLISRTISHLERLRESSKRRKLEVDSLQQQLEQAKKAGEDTAAKLKETMFNQPSGKQQMMMMVPMMMPSPDSMGGHAGMSMMNHPYMSHQAFMQMPQPHHQVQATQQQQQQQHAAQVPAMQQAPQGMFPMAFPQNAAMQQPQQQPQAQMSYMMPQQMQQAFPQMMAAPGVPPSAQVSSAIALSQQQPFQPIQPAPSNNGPADSSNTNASGQGGKGQQSSMSGGNLAHCA